MKITFIGTGYVGLVSGVMMSHLGHEIICLDTDEKKISALQNKQIPIYEPNLQQYVERYTNNNKLKFLHGYNETIKDSKCLFITVGTPQKKNGEADLTGVFKAVETACDYINSDCIIVIKSTVPAGTCKKIKNFIKEQGKNNDVVSNPEFLREGSAIEDFINPDRIVVGANSDRAFTIMREIYKPLTDKNIKLVETDLNTSELIKYASNSFLANKIAFINEMADLCEIVDANITTLAKAVGLDKRIGSDFLAVGPAYGGSCFPKDTLALQQLDHNLNSDLLILDAVIKSNNSRASKMVSKISSALGGIIDKKNLAILGLTYKAKTDDLRSSPAIDIINLLEKKGANIIAYDPEGMDNAHKYFTELKCADSLYSAIKGVDAIVIVTEWMEFKEIDLNKAKNLVKSPIMIDLRNILVPEEVTTSGFKYYSIGQKSDK